MGGAHVTLLCETQRGYANLCRILTDAHARTRVPGKERDLLPAETSLDVLEQHAEGLVVPLRLRATRPRRRRRERHRPTRACVRRRVLRRAAASVRTRRRPPQRPAARSSQRRCACPTVATGDVHAHHQRRARLQDALVAIRNRTSLDGCERERRGNHESVLLSAGRDARAAAARRRAAHTRGRRPLRLRPDAGARLSLSRLLRRRRPCRRAAARDL